MILLDKPFVSDFLRKTIAANGYSVVHTKRAEELGFSSGPNLIDEESAIERALSTEHPLIYTPSKNAFGWIVENLSDTRLPANIELFKNKVTFRKLLQPLYPEFFFKAVSLSGLDELNIEDLSFPFIIKPSVGFFSMGVYKVNRPGQWVEVKSAINTEMNRVRDLYPAEVLNADSFIIEQCIKGEEFAFDAYFDHEGNPVVLNIYKHLFSSSEDFSDRVYITSKEIIEDNIEAFQDFLRQIGALSGVKNFPLHVELRRDSDGTILPIEVNPLRFGGWCTTADATFLAYGVNPYEYYFSQKQPDWKSLLRDKEGKVYSIIVLDNSTGLDADVITSFDYDKLLSRFEKPLEIRKIDHTTYPVFGFLFTETREDNMEELEQILASDLTEFVRTME